MPEDLNRVPWKKLRLHHGNAGEIPKLLRQLRSRKGCANELVDRLGSLLVCRSRYDFKNDACEAYPHVVPFLMELLEVLEPSEQGRVLGYLGAIATSVSREEERRTWPSHDPWEETPEANARMAQEQTWARAARAAVVQSTPTYLELLDAPEWMIWHPAVSLLAQCREQRRWIAPVLTQRLTQRTDPSQTEHLIIALGLLLQGSPLPKAEAALEAVRQDEETPPQRRLAAVLSLLRIRGSDCGGDLLPEIRELSPAHPRLYATIAGSETKALECVAEIFGERAQVYRELLIETARSGVEEARRYAYYWIAELCCKSRNVTDELAPVLLSGLRDPDLGCRQPAARGLAQIAGVVPLPTEPLLEALEGRDVHVSMELVVALGRRREPRMLPFVLELFGDRTGFPWRSAIQAIKELGAEAAPAVSVLVHILNTAQDYDLRSVALNALSVIGPATRPALPAIRAALRERIDLRFAARAFASWGPGATEVIPDLIQLLRRKDYEAQRLAAQALGAFGPTAAAAVAPLDALLSDRDSYLPIYAAFSLWQITGRLDMPLRLLIDRLAQKMDGSKLHGVHPCAEAAHCLGRMGTLAVPAIPALQSRLTHPVRRVRFQSALALWRITQESSASLPLLVDELCTGIPKLAAVEAIREMGEAAAAALPALRHLAESEERVVLLPEGDSAIEEDEAIRRAAAAAIRTIAEGHGKGKKF